MAYSVPFANCCGLDIIYELPYSEAHLTAFTATVKYSSKAVVAVSSPKQSPYAVTALQATGFQPVGTFKSGEGDYMLTLWLRPKGSEEVRLPAAKPRKKSTKQPL